MLNSSWVCCDEVFKATLSGELNDKCAAVIYVWNKKLHINVKLNQTKILIILQYIQRRSLKIPRVKLLKIGPLFVEMMKLVIGSVKERKGIA